MAENPSIKSIRFSGVFGHQLLAADFKPGLNLLHGKNGTGKTTILHILANLLEGDLERFCSIKFERLNFTLSDDTVIVLKQPSEGVVGVTLQGKNLGTVSPALSQGPPTPPEIAEAIAKLFPKRPVYLPAFRSILEAASGREEYGAYRDPREFQSELAAIRAHEERYRNEGRARRFARGPDDSSITASKTVLSRRWFGDFVPIIRYPSLADVSRQLTEEFQHAYFTVTQTNQATFSTVFREVLEAVQRRKAPRTSENIDALLSRVQTQLQALTPADANSRGLFGKDGASIQPQSPWGQDEDQSVRQILEIYDQALQGRANSEAEAYSRLRLFESSFNKFIKPKSLCVVDPDVSPRRGPRVQLTARHSEKLDVLSSGERQVLTMLFCATHMSQSDGIMLIDEPEISLHIDWQRIILAEIMLQAGDRQIIACTHAPEVVAEHRSLLVELSSSEWSSGGDASVEDDAEVESGEGE